MISEITSLSERLKKATELAGGAKSLSSLSGIPYTTLHGYTSGKTEPRASEIVSIATTSGIDVGWLLTGQGEMKRSGAEKHEKSSDDSSQEDAPQLGSPSAKLAQACCSILHRLLLEQRCYKECSPAIYDKLIDLMYNIEMEERDKAIAAGLPPPVPDMARYRTILRGII